MKLYFLTVKKTNISFIVAIEYKTKRNSINTKDNIKHLEELLVS
jgi:hypothetical protein